jgi:two-component system, NtrC family, sensor kinase
VQMKLVHKIILGNVLGIITIVIISVFSYHEVKLIQAKLRFMEIADNLNASFLEMRLSEKNYFLYKDRSALQLIKQELHESEQTISSMRENILTAVGTKNFNRLNSNLKRYGEEIDKIDVNRKNAKVLEADIRETGRALRMFSENIIRLERNKVNQIITASSTGLLYFFCLVLFVATTSTYLFFSKMFKSLRQIEKTANSISEGNFLETECKISNDELGSAMQAINSMCVELKTRHEQLIQSKKLASIGVLTAGVAHELGNPLNNISMVAQTYIELYDQMDKAERLDYMNTVLEECSRIKHIVQNLLDFSRPKQTDFKVSDINAVLKSSLRLVQNMLHVSGVETRVNLQPEIPTVFIDENKIQGVLVNLYTNAIQAMQPGGTLSVGSFFDNNSGHVMIEIEDTGTGISPEFISNIFDPFFSTKGTQGTGLGLSISYGIIKNHQGEIRVKSEIGVGTTFTIELPVYTAKEDIDEWSQHYGN